MILSLILAAVTAVVLFSLKARFAVHPLGGRGSKINLTPPVDPGAVPSKSSFASAPPPVIDTIYAIGDLHGDARCAREWVGATGLLDESFSSWLQPNANLIFVGDYLDKGPTSLQTILFVKGLTDSFPSRVTALMGNHEMEALMDRSSATDRRRYYYQLPYSTVHPDDLLNYLPDPSLKTANTTKALDTLYELALNEVYGKNKFRTIDFSPYGSKSICNLIDDPELASMVREELAMLQSHYINAFSSSTSLGQWTEKRPITHVFEDLVFMHGGLNPAILEFEGGVRSPQDLAELNENFFNHSSEYSIASFMRTLPGQVVYDLLTYRGNHKSCEEVSHVAGALGVSKVIVGHTPDDNVRVTCGDKFLAIDSALGRWIRKNGNQYCRGEETKYSKNGRYVCEKIDDYCDGQIVKMVKRGEGDWDVQLLTSSSAASA